MGTQERISGERVGPAGKAEEGGTDSGGRSHRVTVVSATDGELGVGARQPVLREKGRQGWPG